MITHASLFSGIGGPEIAAQMVGWENVFHCEIRPLCRQVLNYWFPNSKSYEDIKTTDFTEWRGKVDVLTGGFPCQPFSTAGRRGGAEDDRYLWPEMLRAIRECRPTWVVGENVDGLLTMVESPCDVEVARETTLFDEDNAVRRYRRTESFTIERVCQDLEDIGYSVKAFDIPAASVGAPHRRNRVFIVAHAKDSLCVESSGTEIVADESGQRNTWPASSVGAVADPDIRRSHEVSVEGGGRVADGAVPFGICRERTFADTSRNGVSGESDAEGEQTQRPNSVQVVESCEHGRVRRFFGREAGGSLEALLPEQRWRAFPTVSPVYRGNDGLPFPVDHLTIPFTKWRKFSLESYGNAIVPQVMYEIFRCIDLIEKDAKHKVMDKYTIYCTEAQTKMALELGAPLFEAPYVGYFPVVKTDEDTLYEVPTADQMIGFLEELGFKFKIYEKFKNSWFYYVGYRTRREPIKEFDNVKSRPEATLAAIDAALEYLENIKQ